ncbi:MAG: hypothetical protein AAF702_03365 [Chloroflexota bacterium]
MKVITRVIVGVAALLIFCAGYIVIGYAQDYETVEATMIEMCSAIESGMSSSDVKSIAAQYKGVDIMGSTEGIQLSQASQDVGLLGEDWLCICHVQMSFNKVSSVDAPFCVD